MKQLTKIILIFLSSFLPIIINGQNCGTDCSLCSNAPASCNQDSVNRCTYNDIAQQCEIELCGPNCSLCDQLNGGNLTICDADPLCFYLVDNNVCRLKNVCDSDCALCSTLNECENIGAGGIDSICAWINDECFGTTCNTQCENCSPVIIVDPITNLTECESSRAPPNGCVQEPGNAEDCMQGTLNPTINPTIHPTSNPSTNPSNNPTMSPTLNPSNNPTISPTLNPTTIPTNNPTSNPSKSPSNNPTISPTLNPSISPTKIPTLNPSISPTNIPTSNPSNNPSISPSNNPTKTPTSNPTDGPTRSPTKEPTAFPTINPTLSPTDDPTSSPTNGPTSRPPITCGDTRTDNVDNSQPLVYYPLIIPFDVATLIISTCDGTQFNSTLTLFNPIGNIIAFDQDGCNDVMGRAKIEINNLMQDDYAIIIGRARDDIEGLFQVSIQCITSMPTASPTTDEPTTSNPTTAIPTLSPITKKPSSSPTKPPSKSPTNNPTTAKPTRNPTINPTEIPTSDPTDIPTITPTVYPTFDPTTPHPTPKPTTHPTSDPTLVPTVKPTLGPTVKNLCPDCPYNVSLIMIGNVTIEQCPTLWPTPKPTRRYYWRHRNSDSSGSHIHADSDSDSESESGNGYDRWWNGHKKCVGGWDNGSGSRSSSWSDSVSNSDSNSRNRRRLMDSSWDGTDQDSKSSDSDSDSNDGGFNVWYKNKCIDNDESSNSKSDSDSNDGSWRQRKRGWSGSDSDSDSSSGSDDGYVLWKIDDNDEFITEVCIKYAINDLIKDDKIDCGEVESVFFGLCENNKTDFNSSTLTEDDLNGLIVSIHPDDPSLIDNVEGIRNKMGDLGILVEFKKGHNVNIFELCLGNVTVDSNFNAEKEMIDIGDGIAKIKKDDITSEECPSDGLPCLNFIFDVPCPPKTDCDCIDGITELTMRYEGKCDAASIKVYYDEDMILCQFSNIRIGEEITCNSSPNDRFEEETVIVIKYSDYCDDSGDDSNDGRRRQLLDDDDDYQTETDSDDDDDDDSNDDEECLAKFKTKCSENIIGTKSEGCNALKMISFIDGTGNICNDIIIDDDVLSDSNSDSNDGDGNYNALIGDDKKINDAFELFNNLDPFIKWTLIGIMSTFIILMFIACYICIGIPTKQHHDKNQNKIKKKIENINEMNKNKSLSAKYGTVTLHDDEYYDQECYFSDKGMKHQQIATVDDDDDDDDDDYYVETDNDHNIKSVQITENDYNDKIIEMMKAVSSR